MTIGWVGLIVAIITCLFVAPVPSLAVLAVGAMPFLVVNFSKSVATGLLWAVAYICAVAGAGALIYYDDSGAILLLGLFLPLIMIVSWAVALD